jgi:hypothetical protein
MSLICFTDGVEVDTSGELRTLELEDGWYVVGCGKLAPCANQLEAIAIRDELLSGTVDGGKRPLSTD